MNDQCESGSYTMVRSGEDLSPGSSQYVIASDAEPRAITRVMSPNPNDSILSGITTPCLRCAEDVQEPIVCTGCGDYGHPLCLSIEFFKGYPWCGKPGCFMQTVTFYGQMDEQTREQWTRTLPEHMNFWKRTARDSLGIDDPNDTPANRTFIGLGTGMERNSLGIPFTPAVG